MLDGTLFIVKCARCGNPGKNVYQDFFMFFLHYNVRMVSRANLGKEEREQYETEWKIYNDYFNTIESTEKKTAAEAREIALVECRAECRAKGREEGISSIVHYMKSNGMSIEDIAKTTGLALKEIENPQSIIPWPTISFKRQKHPFHRSKKVFSSLLTKTPLFSPL